jgi:hypothetical protein
MRSLFAPAFISALILLPSAGGAADTSAGHESYRGYYIDLSEIAGQNNFREIEAVLRQQVDIVEGVGLSSRVLNFFKKVPIIFDELACLDNTGPDAKSGTTMPRTHDACYSVVPSRRSWENKRSGFAVWDSRKSQWEDSDPIQQAVTDSVGVVSVRPDIVPNAQRPVLLHEMLHAYHANVLPQGVKNETVLFYYKQAKDGGLYPADTSLMTDEREFFAVTVSVFLYGKDGLRTRSELRKKQPEYYRYLIWLFGRDAGSGPSADQTAALLD